MSWISGSEHGPKLSTQQQRLCAHNIAACKAYREAKLKAPIEGISLGGHLHHLKPAPMRVKAFEPIRMTAVTPPPPSSLLPA